MLVIDCGSPKTPELQKVLRELGRALETVKLASLSPGHISKAKGIIITGSPVLITESYPKLFAYKFSFLGTVNVPVLGICFGHQVMGLVHGETVFKGEAMRKEEEITFMFDDPLLEGIPQKAVFQEDHTEGIELPDDDFYLLGSSNSYGVEAMKHKKKNMYGLQFHPEVSGENGKKLLENFCKMVGY
ncbi:MAG TPA: gamma-glutamyl-gamma-aminobutyrate hydrolase family protein [Bacteroidia bacterium]|jgi:GMP synthase (glutamine-hydrolysing)